MEEWNAPIPCSRTHLKTIYTAHTLRGQGQIANINILTLYHRHR